MNKKKEPKRYTLLMSESSDWYLCPLEKLDEGNKVLEQMEEDKCDFLEYVQDPWCVSFTDPKRIKND